MSSSTVVEARDLGRIYHLYKSPADRLKQAFTWGRRQYYREFWAVRGVSLAVARGEAFGIIGRNGSGKSTLLQIVAGILEPSEGACEVRGKSAALLELGSGFNPEFSGRENVYLNGSLLGLSRREIDRRYDEIVDFAEIGEFVDQPVKTYSSGMVVRLAFAVQVCIEPDLLIVDEALSVGDIFFQQKCFARIQNTLERGTALLFVSHDTAAVRVLCKRALFLNDGRPIFEGNSAEAVSRYHASIGSPVVRRVEGEPPSPDPDPNRVNRTASADGTRASILNNCILPPNSQQHGAGKLVVLAVRVTDDAGRDALSVDLGKHLNFDLLLRANRDAQDPSAGLHLYDRFGNLVFAAGTRQIGPKLPDLSAGSELIIRLRVCLSVQPGQYSFSVGASLPSSVGGPNVGHVQDSHEDLGPIDVVHDSSRKMPFFGIARLNLEASYTRV